MSGDNKKQNESMKKDQANFPTLSHIGSVEELGTQIGHYKLLSVLGEGGFGIVYLAEQKKPVRRQVALKVIKPGMDSKQVIARFESERQALALLDHPNIARIFDGGTTEAGRPYFVMELVKGLPITEYCDKHKLSIEERLELFQQVCEAVQHAHQKGIIHRDIKPSNILVYTQDGKPTPMIIDFGVAKAVNQPLTEKTLFTEQGQFIGTPEYMSPEQAGMTILDIDTRSDIYSLGVVLYELLTGTLPFTRDELERAGFAEIQRIIRETDPPRPSTRLSSLGEEGKEVAESRRTEITALTKRLHKELEWIPLKAMRKEADRRYKTASELADDIRNYLSGDPLIAGPESRTYRLKKTIKRHRVMVAAISTIVIVLLIGVVVSTTMYFRSEQAIDEKDTALKEREVALVQVKEERDKAQEAKNAEQRQRELAEKRAEEIKVSSYFDKIHLADKEIADGEIFSAMMFLDSCPEDLCGWEWYYLCQICRSAGKIWLINEHLGLFSQGSSWREYSLCSDGNRIAGFGDGRLVVWDVVTGSKLISIEDNDNRNYGVSLSTNVKVFLNADGSKLLSVGIDNTSRARTIKVWDITSGSCITTITRSDKSISSVAFSPDGKRVIISENWFSDIEGWNGERQSWNSNIVVWDINKGKKLFNLYRDIFPSSVAYSRNGERIITYTSYSNRPRVWNAVDGKLVQDFSKTPSPFHLEAVISADGRLIASCDSSSIGIWDVKTGEQRFIISTKSKLEHIAFDPTNTYILGADKSGMIRVWKIASNDKEELAIRGHPSGLQSVVFSKDGRQIVSLGNLDTVGIWRFSKTESYQARLVGEKRSIGLEVMDLSADREQFVTIDRNEFCIQDIKDGKIGPYDSNMAGVYAVAMSQNGKYVVAGNAKGTIKIWDSVTGNEKWKTNVKNNITSVAFKSDNKQFATGDNRGNVTIWDLAKQAPTHNFRVDETIDTSSIRSIVKFSPDGTRILASWLGKLIIWDIETGNEIWTSNDEIATVSFSPDGKRIVGGEMDGVTMWDSETGDKIWSSSNHKYVRAVDFSPDGKRVISSGAYGMVKICDANTGIELLTLNAQEDVKTIGFSRPDGKFVLAGCSDGKVRIWDSSSDTNVIDKAYWRLQGFMYCYIGYFDKAIIAMNNAIEIDPKDSELYRIRGQAYIATQDYDKAIEDLGRAIQMYPDDVVCLGYRVMAYKYTKQYDKAIKDLGRIIHLDPNHLYALYGRAQTYLKIKQYDKAIADIDTE
ncbi:protein kinase [Planctomycetota bacterium]